MSSSNASDRRKSTRKKCPVENAGLQLVFVKPGGSDDELLPNLKVKLKKYPCRIVPAKKSLVNCANSKENICPDVNAEARHKNKLNTSRDLESDDSSDEQLLAEMKAKKYPTRKRGVTVKKSSVDASKGKKDMCSDDKVLSEKTNRKNIAVKKAPVHVSNSTKDISSDDEVLSEKRKKKKEKSLAHASNCKNDDKVLADKADRKNVSVEKSCVNISFTTANVNISFTTANVKHTNKHNTKTTLESDNSSDDEEVAVKKSSAHASNGKETIGSDDDAKVTDRDELNTNKDLESDKTSDDEISDIEVTNNHHDNSSVDRKTYPQRKRKGSLGTHVENDSNNNSLYKTALHKKMKTALGNDGSLIVKDDSSETSSSKSSSKFERCDFLEQSDLQQSEEMNEHDEEERCDDVQMESEVDQEHVEILPNVFNSVHNRTDEIDTEKENGDELEGIEGEHGEKLKDEDDMEEENVIRARVLSSNALDGQSIYGFATPKRKDALARIAQDVIESAKKSSKKSSKKSASKSAATTPKSSSKKPGKSSTSRDDDDDTKEPDRKTRNKVTLLRTLAANDSEGDDEDEESSGGEESDEYEESPEKSSTQEKKDDRDLLDEYFEVHGKFKSLTSDKTLAKLKNPKMDQQDLLKHLKGIQTSHVKEIVKLHSIHQCQYKNWMFNLLSGFNVLVYGFGSKHMLLEKFRKTMLQDKVHIVVNGFFPSIQLKQVLKTVTEEILEKETSFKNTIEHYKYVTKEYNSGTAGKLFIIIHNIDGHMLRSQNVQTALAHLASSRNIHIIASIDHISAPLIWDQNRASAFNWLWYDTTTFESYSEETSYENSLMVQQSGTLALSSLKHVLHSLTSNSKGIFRVLADYHMDNEDNTSYQGMSFGDLYQRCRERFLVNSDLTLRSQLTEFRDHKLIKSKKGYDGVEYISIALDCSTLKIYLEEEDS